LANRDKPDNEPFCYQREFVCVIHSLRRHNLCSPISPLLGFYSFAIADDCEMNPRTNLLAEETGGSSLAEFKMNVSSEEKWMNAASSGLKNPKAAKPTPILSAGSTDFSSRSTRGQNREYSGEGRCGILY